MVKKQAESVDFAAMSARTFAYCFRYNESWTRYLAIMPLRVHTWARVPCTHARVLSLACAFSASLTFISNQHF
jgi:hypothetical protein